MKKVILILLFLCFISVGLFAQDSEILPGNIAVFDNPNSKNADTVYIASTEHVDLPNLDIRNKIIYFCTNNPHIYDDFHYYFNTRFKAEIIVRHPYTRNKFPDGDSGDKLRSIASELWDISERNLDCPATTFRTKVVANDRYGVLLSWMGMQFMQSYFFEIKTP